MRSGSQLNVWRHIIAFLLLPFMAAVAMPLYLLSLAPTWDTRWSVPPIPLGLLRCAALLVLLAGAGLFAWCLSLFARVGQGTLAPWDPPVKLVMAGPYRHVRNPMISAVALVLVGEAGMLGSRVLGLWWLTFVIVNHVYFLAVEEPGLRRRFGKPYERYVVHVPRWLPRLRPWRG